MRKNQVVNIADARKQRAPKGKPGSRTAWSALTKKELARPGALLLATLFAAANERGQQLRELATALGVTYGYLAQLRSGLRFVAHISQEFVEACAQYLGLPPIAVKVMAGKVGARDFVWPAKPVEEVLNAALLHIQADQLLGGMMPASVYNAPQEVKAFAVACYEQACTQEAMPSRSLPQLLQDLQRAAVSQADYEVELARASSEDDDTPA